MLTKYIFICVVMTFVLILFFCNSWLGYVGASQTRYLKQVPLFSSFLVQSQLVFWDHKWFFMRHKLIMKEELCIETLVRVVVKDKTRTVKPS